MLFQAIQEYLKKIRKKEGIIEGIIEGELKTIYNIYVYKFGKPSDTEYQFLKTLRKTLTCEEIVNRILDAKTKEDVLRN